MLKWRKTRAACSPLLGMPSGWAVPCSLSCCSETCRVAAACSGMPKGPVSLQCTLSRLIEHQASPADKPTAAWAAKFLDATSADGSREAASWMSPPCCPCGAERTMCAQGASCPVLWPPLLPEWWPPCSACIGGPHALKAVLDQHSSRPGLWQHGKHACRTAAGTLRLGCDELTQHDAQQNRSC